MQVRRRTVEFSLLSGLCVLLFFFRLSAFGLLGADEPRYAQVAREMLERHDWVTPILYGHTWLEKPIAYYWGAMLSYIAFGINDASARVPSAFFAALMVAAVYFIVGRIRPNARLEAAIMVASSALVIGMARAASTDMALSGPFCIAMLSWFLAEHLAAQGISGRLWIALSYAALAVATLAKGPIAPVLAFMIVIAYAVFRREPKAILRTLWIPGILVFFAIAAPWFVLVQMRTPEFFRVFILEHNLGRFGSNMFRHPQPFWYYIPVALVATAPWTFFVLTAFVENIRSWWRTRNTPDPSDDGFRLFLLLWIIIPIVFFSASRSKLPGYILPAIPPCLILAAEWIHRKIDADERVPFWLAGAHAILLASLAAALIMAPAIMLKAPASIQAMMLAGVFGSVVFVGVVLSLLVRGWPVLRFATLVPLVLFIGFILRVLAPTIDITQSSRPVAHLVEKVNVTGLPVSTFKVRREIPFGFGFYLDKKPMPYDGLEVSPNVYNMTPAVPSQEHLLVVREGSADDLRQLLSDREILPVGYLRAQHLEILHVAASK